ncbi:hypothetical protein POM88_016173 [Heracleum sosnowskyi]|uniref:Uncharacterized protein n=1 Tax=Heracleum sosnowskyi TaxID=360622 RepID=A0AAD8ILN0_9APIA|nr:hypothetical protein POM88_016173 [Heracleum sosnowskyi]
MGTSINELDHASSPSVSEHDTRTDGDLKTSSPAAANELNSVNSSKNLDISSSSLSNSPSPDSPSEHPHSTTTPSQAKVEGNDKLDSSYEKDKHEPSNVEHDNPPQGTSTPFKVKEDASFDTARSKYEHETPTAESPASTSDAETPDAKMPLFTLGSGDDKENYETLNVNVALSTLSPELSDSTFELGSNDPTTSPPTQVMERPSKYRIPSSVFARSQSNNPDWSTASNESLFSIQMGNMSFRKDDLWKSGEIGLKSAELEMIKNGDLDMLRSGEQKSGELETQSGELGTKNGDLGTGTREPEIIPGQAVAPTEPSMSTQMFSYSQNPNMATSNSGKTAELGVAIETMKEVIREATDQKSKNSNFDGPTVGISNDRSSTESFAFSSGADNSVRVGSTAKSDTGSSPNAQSQSQTQSTSQPKEEHEPKSPAADLHTAKPSWFSCMSCYWCRPYCCL